VCFSVNDCYALRGIHILSHNCSKRTTSVCRACSATRFDGRSTWSVAPPGGARKERGCFHLLEPAGVMARWQRWHGENELVSESCCFQLRFATSRSTEDLVFGLTP